MKEFPEIYKSKIDKIKSKVQNEFYCRNNEEKPIIKKVDEVPRAELIKKINSIFTRPDYVYQADVIILYKNGKNMNKKIVGVKDNYIITFDGELINIDDIYDIK